MLFPLHERLKGRSTHARLEALERSQWLRPERLAEVQFEGIRRHLEFAYREVPYYRQLLDKHELQPWRIGSMEDFSRIPCLTRDAIREHFEDLQSRTKLRRVQRMSTGGSTGTPVTVLVDSERMAATEAARLRAHRWFGVDMGVREIVLWGSPIELTKQDLVRTVRDWLLNSHLLSAFDLGEPALRRYADIIQRVKPAKLYGYATAIHLLARYLGRAAWRPEPGWPRAIFTTAEPLYGFQRRDIEDVFGCPVAVEYGCRDGGLVANECSARGLHIPAEGMVVEVLPASDQSDDGRGELVVTNLDSFAMPIIRYRTGDVGALETAPCSCGRGLPRLRAVDGRRTDFLVTPTGKVMHALAVIYVLREIPSIREFQVVQERLDHLRVRIVPDGDFSGEAREIIAVRLAELFGGRLSLEIELEQAIPRSSAGKHRYVISRVAEQYLDRLVGAG